MNSFWRGETESLRVGDQFVLTVIEIGSTTIRFWLEDTHHPDESRIVEIDRPDIESPGDRSDDHFFAYSNVPLDARWPDNSKGADLSYDENLRVHR